MARVDLASSAGLELGQLGELGQVTGGAKAQVSSLGAFGMVAGVLILGACGHSADSDWRAGCVDGRIDGEADGERDGAAGRDPDVDPAVDASDYGDGYAWCYPDSYVVGYILGSS